MFRRLRKKNLYNFCIIVEDNGRGLPNDIEINNSKSLGFKLVYLLARQLNANINIDKNKGA